MGLSYYFGELRFPPFPRPGRSALGLTESGVICLVSQCCCATLPTRLHRASLLCISELTGFT